MRENAVFSSQPVLPSARRILYASNYLVLTMRLVSTTLPSITKL